MCVVVGLGNPGKEYAASLHNLGFRVVDRVAERLKPRGWPKCWKRQFESLLARGDAEGRAYWLLKPQTYMNSSGEAVAALLRYYQVPLEGLLVVLDDLDLPAGKIRQRTEGSDGGHRGLRSIIECVGSRQFKRLRIGIGRPEPGQSAVAKVLGSKVLASAAQGGAQGQQGEAQALHEAVDLAARQAEQFIASGAFESWSSP